MLDFDKLAGYKTIDLTTTGRRSGRARRIEIWWFRIDGRFVITGTPGPRDWLANVKVDPRVTVHVGSDDIPARVVPILDPDLRRRVFEDGTASWYTTQVELDLLVEEAPMVEVLFDSD